MPAQEVEPRPDLLPLPGSPSCPRMQELVCRNSNAGKTGSDTRHTAQVLQVQCCAQCQSAQGSGSIWRTPAHDEGGQASSVVVARAGDFSFSAVIQVIQFDFIHVL